MIRGTQYSREALTQTGVLVSLGHFKICRFPEFYGLEGLWHLFALEYVERVVEVGHSCVRFVSEVDTNDAIHVPSHIVLLPSREAFVFGINYETTGDVLAKAGDVCTILNRQVTTRHLVDRVVPRISHCNAQERLKHIYLETR